MIRRRGVRMIRRIAWADRTLPPWAGYSFAVLAPGAALLLQISLQAVLRDLHFFMFFPTVLLTAAVGGLGPGLAAAALSAALAIAFLSPPEAGFAFTAAAGAMFIVVSGALVLLIHSLKVLLTERTDNARRETLLRRELQHRIGNFVQMTLSVARMQAKAETEPAAKAALEVFRHRIQAFAQVQQEIVNPHRRSLSEVLGEICRTVSRSFVGDRVQCEFDIDKELLIAPDQLQSVALIVNELVMNSLKHAFEGDEQGRIQVQVSQPDPGWVSIDYTDTGRALPSNFDLSNSTRSGLKIIKALADQLGGSFEVTANPHKRFRVRFQLRDPGSGRNPEIAPAH